MWSSRRQGAVGERVAIGRNIHTGRLPTTISAGSVVAMNCITNGGLGGNGPVEVGVPVQRVEAMVAIWGDRRYSDAIAGVRTSVGE